MKNPRKAKTMGERGREVVRRKFLSTAHINSELQLFASLLGSGKSGARSRATTRQSNVTDARKAQDRKTATA